MTDTDPITQILSSYINRRDQAKKSSPFYEAGNTGVRAMAQFSAMIDAHHQQIAAYLPLMNIAGMEEFCAYFNASLHWLRSGTDKPIEPAWLAGYISHLPVFNLAELEAFTELMMSRLNWMRPRSS